MKTLLVVLFMVTACMVQADDGRINGLDFSSISLRTLGVTDSFPNLLMSEMDSMAPSDPIWKIADTCLPPKDGHNGYEPQTKSVVIDTIFDDGNIKVMIETYTIRRVVVDIKSLNDYEAILDYTDIFDINAEGVFKR